ncbi:hypothetical protein AB0C34_25165 [Nocardia sp. NPDC049220]|uniref:ATP-grasp domain-containing protein n=1 Tax=Nocardia sp. NPDC049220 TaxID=3155273 RepID=UPI00340D3685
MKPHITILHRVRGVDVSFASHIDHSAYSVSYICTEHTRKYVPDSAAMVVVLDDFSAAPVVAREFRDTFGTPERIVGLSEYDLLTAARLREEFDVTGDRPDHVHRFRDKLPMGESIAAAGIPIPAFAAAPDQESVRQFAQLHGFPVIVKPRLGAGSVGVVKVDSEDDIAALPDLTSEPYMTQQYCPDDIGFIDGVWDGSQLGPWRASYYLNNCLDFATTGGALGTVEIDDPRLEPHFAEFTESVCATLAGKTPTVFHLEYFLGHRDDGSPHIRFLEVAARISGGETPNLWREVHDYDLIGAALDIQLGRPLHTGQLTDGLVIGDLIIRPPTPPPCTIVATHLELPDGVGPYWQQIPATGSQIQETAGYQDIGASFRFRGHSSTEVRTAIEATTAGFRMECVPYQTSQTVSVG